MAKLDLIDRTALVAELESYKECMADPVLRLVVARVIDRVRVQPVVAPAVEGPLGECETCKHRQLPMHSEPCASCGLGCYLGRNWEAADG